MSSMLDDTNEALATLRNIILPWLFFNPRTTGLAFTCLIPALVKHVVVERANIQKT